MLGSLLTQRRSTHTVPSFLYLLLAADKGGEGRLLCAVCLRTANAGRGEAADAKAFYTLCHLFLYLLLAADKGRERKAAARLLLARGKCGGGREPADAKANKGKASNDSFTIGSSEEDPG